MRLHFVSVPIHGSAAAEEEVNQFLASHRVIAVDRQLVADGPRTAWGICITYVVAGAGAVIGASSGAAMDTNGKKRIDYREILHDAEFQVFAKLREQLAEREVHRGGSWNSNARNVRAANRNANPPENRNDNLGFRLAREQERVGRPAPDPTFAASGPLEAGETQAGAGVEVAAADAPSKPRRWPTYFYRRMR